MKRAIEILLKIKNGGDVAERYSILWRTSGKVYSDFNSNV